MNLGNATAYMDLDASKLLSGLKQVTKDMKALEKDSMTMTQKMDSVGSTMQNVGGALTAAVSVPLIGIGVASVNTAATFESSMSQVAATMGMTSEDVRGGSEEFKKLEQAALDMGSSTKFSASQASEALNFLALAGYDSTTSIETLPKVLNLAAAGGMQLQDAADMVTDSLAALGLEARDAERFTDVLAKTSQKSNTSVAQLGEAILTVGGTAKTLSGGLEEASTVLGIFADAGIKGSEGGTALRNTILSLQAPTDKSKELMTELGLEVFDAEGKMRPLNDTFNDLNDIMADMTDEEKANVLSTIFNKADLKSVNALLANSGERFNELNGEIMNAEGSAKTMADVMSDNLSGSIDSMKSALEGAGIAIGQVLIPFIRQAIDGVTDMLQAFNNLSEGEQQMIVFAGGIAASIGIILGVVGTLIRLFTNLGKIFALVGGSISAVTVVITAFIAVLVGMAAYIGSSNDAIQSLQDKFGVFGFAIGAVCEGIWGAIQLVFGNLIIAVGTIGKVIGAVLTGDFKAIPGIIKEGWAEAESNTAQAMSNIKGETSIAFKKIAQQTESDMQSVVNVFDTALQELPNLTAENVDQMAVTFTNSLQGMDNDGLTILRGTSDTMATVLDGITADMIGTKAGADKFRENLESIARTGGVSSEQLKTEIGGALESINHNWQGSGEQFKQTATDIFNAVGTASTQGVDDMATNVSVLLQGLDQESAGQLRSMGTTWAQLMQGITVDGSMSFDDMKAKILENYNSIEGEGSEKLSKLREESKTHTSGMTEDIIFELESQKQAMTEGEQGKAEAVKEGGEQQKQAVTEAEQAKTEAIRQGAEEQKQAVADGEKSKEESVKGGNQGQKEATREGERGKTEAVKEGNAQTKAEIEKGGKANTEAHKQSMSQLSKVSLDESGKIPKDIQTNMQQSVQIMRQAGSDIYNGMNTSFSKTASQGKQHFSDLYNGTTRSTSQMRTKIIADWNAIKGALGTKITGKVEIKATGVQETLNQISKIKDAAKKSIEAPQYGDVDAFQEGLRTVNSGNVASVVSNYRSNEAFEIKISSDEAKKKKKEDPQINVSLNIENFVNESKQDAEQLANEISYVIKRKTIAMGGV